MNDNMTNFKRVFTVDPSSLNMKPMGELNASYHGRSPTESFYCIIYDMALKRARDAGIEPVMKDGKPLLFSSKQPYGTDVYVSVSGPS